MTDIAIVYFSGYGHTTKLAEAVAEGVDAVGGSTAKMFALPEDGDIPEAWWGELAQVSGIIYGSPTYMGMVPWQFKKFADASSGPWYQGDWRDTVAGGFTVSASVNGDKHSTIAYLVTLAMQHGQVWVGTGLKPRNAKEHGPSDVNWTAGYTGLLAIAPSDATPDEAPRSGDLETARIYGRRIAHAAASVASARDSWPTDS
ncbi:MAG: flavodoxin family protein [Pseudomonadota bacterium]